MKKLIFISFLTAITFCLKGQENIRFSHQKLDHIIRGEYDPADYETGLSIETADLGRYFHTMVSPDTLQAYIQILSSFQNRNTGSDTISANRGIGAARRWVNDKFKHYSRQHDNRLVTGYLDFERNICGMRAHRNVVALLPGSQIEDHGVIIIQAHLDSRCEDRCDVNCDAEGVEDNASGSALVMELARVMSSLSLPQTVLFMCTTGEEQGLWGASALATYASENNIPVRAVLNNDIVGGIICGKTSSEPSCPGENAVDSTQVRLFSAGSTSSSKQLARFIRLQYEELIRDHVNVAMQLTVMSGEDRVGRGGDHIPFRQEGFPAMRFTSAHEHGNGAGNDPDYHDRQHSVRDILGVDTDGDNLIDSFFIDFNYLARNTVINGSIASLITRAPKTPDLEVYRLDQTDLRIVIKDPLQYGNYRVTVREQGTYWDSIYTFQDTFIRINFDEFALRFVSVASVDSNGQESLFSEEKFALQTDVSEIQKLKNKIELLQNRPNPFDEATWITIVVKSPVDINTAVLKIHDPAGKEIISQSMNLQEGINDYLFNHGFKTTGVYRYSLWIDGQHIDTKGMIFAY